MDLIILANAVHSVLVPDLKAFEVNLQTLYPMIAHFVMLLPAQLDKLANRH